MSRLCLRRSYPTLIGLTRAQKVPESRWAEFTETCDRVVRSFLSPLLLQTRFRQEPLFPRRRRLLSNSEAGRSSPSITPVIHRGDNSLGTPPLQDGLSLINPCLINPCLINPCLINPCLNIKDGMLPTKFIQY